MRKLLLFLCALLTGVSTMWAQNDPVTLTFNHDTSQTAANAEVAVNVAGIEGVSATFQQLSNYPYANGALVTNAILCPNVNRNADPTPTIQYQITLTGMPTDYTFNTYAMYVHAFASQGSSYQQSPNRTWGVFVQIDDEDFVSDPALDVCKNSVFKQTHTLRSETSKTTESGTLTLLLTIKGATGVGCFFGLESITLSNVQTTEVTYHLMYNGADKATEAVEEQLGTAPALPSSLQRDYCSFTYYSDEACTQQIETITDETNDIYIKAEVNTEELPFVLSTDYNSATWYYLHGHSTYANTYISTNEDATVYATGNSMTAAYLWAFLGNPIDGIKLINMASGEEKALQGTSPATMGTDGKAWILKKQTATGHNYGVGKSFGLYDTQLTYLNTQDGTLKYWGSFDQGSTFWVEDPETVYQALIAELETIASSKIGNGLGQYHWSNGDKTSEIQSLKSAGYTLENSAKVLALFDEMTLNMPKEGMFLRFQGKFDKYLADGNSSTGPYSYTTNEDATTIFYFDGSHLVNLSSGQSVGMTNGNSATEGWPWYYGTEQATTVTFSEGSQEGKYFVHAGTESSNAYLKINADEDCVRRAPNTDASGAFDWKLTEITTLPISIITAIGYATLWTPVALSIPEGVTAYTGVVNENKDYLNLTKLDGVIPAETAVVLQGAAGSYGFGVTTDDTSVDGNALKGGLGLTTPGNILTLQQPEGYDLGFYTYDNENGLAGFKAYLPWASQGIKGIAFGTDTTDGIATVEGAATESSAIYNLAGQRVEKAVKGVYIVNGKKVLVK